MLIDNESLMSEAQAVTVSAASTNVLKVDMGDGDAGASEGMEVLLNVDESAAAAGAATVNIQLQTSDTSDFASAEVLAESGAIGKADLVAGSQHFKIRLPRGCKKYIRTYYEVDTGPLTAGKFTAAIINGRDAGFGC